MDKITELENKITELENKFKSLTNEYQKHQHDNIDGTNILRKSIEIDRDQTLKVGFSDYGSAPITNLGATNEQIQHSLSISKDTRKGFVNKTEGLQLNFLEQPNNTLKQSFITSFRGTVVTALPSQTVSVSSGGNTITINNFNFTINQLAGESISIYDSSGSFIETRIIASNTSTVITITGTWGATTNGGTFIISTPVFLGSADSIWQRFYTQEGTSGGIRFGMGTTGGGQNGLLYMDATGDLYWRNKSGVSTKLN